MRAPGTAVPHVAWFIGDEDREALVRIATATRPYHGAIHPRISAILGDGWHGERLVFEVEDDRGPTLGAAARQLEDPVLRERWVIAQFIGIADALATLRGRDATFIHRQLEPRKLFVDEQGHARLRAPIAFVAQGERAARMGAGELKLQPGFMSPEQAKAIPLTAASDVFALAGLLYHTLSGRRPFEHENVMTELTSILQTEPPRLAWEAPGLAEVLARAFAKDPNARTPDPGTFAGELWQCVPDATDYDAVISDKVVVWRAQAPTEPAYTPLWAKGACRMGWDELSATPNAAIRHCGMCNQHVVQVRSIAALVPLLGDRCVHYTGGE